MGRWHATTIAGGDARELLHQGLALLLALAAPVSVVGQGGRRSKSSVRSCGASARNRNKSSRLGGGAGIAAGAACRSSTRNRNRRSGAGGGAGASSRVNGRDGPGRFIGLGHRPHEGASGRDGRPAYNISELDMGNFKEGIERGQINGHGCGEAWVCPNPHPLAPSPEGAHGVRIYVFVLIQMSVRECLYGSASTLRNSETKI
jgi:hypothetical protein